MTAILTAIGTPAQTSGSGFPDVVFALDIATANVLRSARTAFAALTNASMKNVRSGFIGDEDSDCFYLFTVDKSAPIGGGPAG